jgi:tRNA (cmo5U34)-methyltransferase
MKKEFSFNTIEDFDKHINMSIPNYKFAIEQIKKYSDYFIQPYTNVYDLGCSTGQFLKSLDRNKNTQYFGIDNSVNLLPQEQVIDGNLFFFNDDLNDFKFNTASFVTSIFTLPFIPKVKRIELINKISESLIPGGAFISCEKVYSIDPKLQDMTNSMYYEFKRNAFDSNEILDKEVSLRKMMYLQSLNETIKDLSVIGPTEIFWKSFNFVGLISIKSP